MEAREARCRRRGFYDQQSVRPTTLALEAKNIYGRDMVDRLWVRDKKDVIRRDKTYEL